MKILQLCKKFPYPLRDGESIAVVGLSRSLREAGAEISLLAMNTSKHFYKLGQLPAQLGHYKSVEAVAVDNRLKVWPALKNLFTRDSYHVIRFDSPQFRTALIRMLRETAYDVVLMETPFLSIYLPEIRKYAPRARVVMRAHNVEHAIWQQLEQNTEASWKKWYLGLQSRRLKAYETERLNSYDLLVPISSNDRTKFRSLGYKGPALVAPAGIRLVEYAPDFRCFTDRPTLSFIGSLDWIPNQEGLDWFLEHVWPGLRKGFPEVQFHVAGRNMPGRYLKKKIPGVRFHGEVPSARKFLNEHPISVVPLQSGSGMRIKILESMGLGRVVITTPAGLEGIPAEHGKEVLVASTAREFRDCLAWSLTQPEEMQRISQHARELVEREFDEGEIGKKLFKTLQDQVFEKAK